MKIQGVLSTDDTGVVWIRGIYPYWETSPAWSGPFKYWRACRWAKKNNVELI